MSATTFQNACPVCDTELTTDAVNCPNCHTDLRLFAPSSEMALDFYNDGLDLARTGDRQGAIDKLRGALASDPKLVNASIVLGKLLAQSGHMADLEQAIVCWERARGFQPTGEQSRKLDVCIEEADRELKAGKRQAAARNRAAFGAIAAGAVVLAAVCGGVGYILRPAQVAPAVVSAHPSAAGTGPAAINTIAAAPPVTANQVEHMLRLFVNGLGHNSDNPLHNASLSVSGGANNAPLKITGMCASPQAMAEVARLVNEVYPSANSIDVSGLIVHPTMNVQVATKWHKGVSRLSTDTYTVQPGESLSLITQKYGHNITEWHKLWEPNRQALRDANKIPSGTVLKVPPGWKVPRQAGDKAGQGH